MTETPNEKAIRENIEDGTPGLYLILARDRITNLEHTLEESDNYKSFCEMKAKIERLLDALKEIVKCEGEFSLDPTRHCINTVDNMKAIAKAAYTKFSTEK